MSKQKIGEHIEVVTEYDYDGECYRAHVVVDSFSQPYEDRLDAEAAAETKLREMYAALAGRFAPVLRWRGDTAELDHWKLSIGQQPDGGYWWDAMLGDDFGVDGGDCASEDEARSAAENGLRGLHVVFRVERE